MVIIRQQMNNQLIYLFKVIIFSSFFLGCAANKSTIDNQEISDLNKIRNDVVVKVLGVRNAKLHSKVTVKFEIDNKRKTPIQIDGVSFCIPLLKKANESQNIFIAKYSEGVPGSDYVRGTNIEIIDMSGGFASYCVGETDTRIAPIYVPAHTKQIQSASIVLDFPYRKNNHYKGSQDYFFDDTIRDNNLVWVE